jgi:hypothetical protein
VPESRRACPATTGRVTVAVAITSRHWPSTSPRNARPHVVQRIRDASRPNPHAMTAPLRSTPHASALPASQTAPVIEFRCLFTHDVRQKKKRWQDGYLKLHTFNNRIMVCDQARNHVGDTYWKESSELQEGDELSLGCVLVEVSEAMAITQTDLAPILARKTKTPTKETSIRPTPSATVRPFQRPSSVAPNNTARAASQLRHKSLNTLLGTPKGPVGKAAPMESPYEVRKEKEKENGLAGERAPKRQKVMQRPTGWRASSPVQEDESPPVKTTVLRAGTADARSGRTPQAMPRPDQVITISSESDHLPVITSDVTLPSTPAKAVKSVSALSVTSVSLVSPSVLPEPQSVQTPKLPRAKIRLPKSKPIETPKRPPPTSSPPVSASNRLTNVDFAVQPVQEPQKGPSPPPSLPLNPKAKSLRLSTGVRRGTLMCQSMPRSASRPGSQARVTVSKPSAAKTPRLQSKEPSPVVVEVHDGRAEIGDMPIPVLPPAKGKRKSPPAGPVKRSKKVKAATPPLPQEADIFDDPEVIHGLMDQQLMIPSSPIESHQPPPSPARKAPVPKPKDPKANTARNGNVKKDARKRATPEIQEDDSSKEKLPLSKSTTKKATPAKKEAEKLQAISIVPPAQPILEPPAPHSRDVSPAHTDGSGSRSRTNSTSPTKPLLSTGGFKKQPKRSSKVAAASTPNSEVTKPAPADATAALPPHPSKKGLLMSTTELAALLSKPKKRTHIDDPIEDDLTQLPTTTKSPARKIRRVRSENDAPIPSTADDWEKRNLPKTSSDLVEPEPEPVKKKVSALAALVKKTDPRRRIQRTQSLVVDTSGGVDEEDLPSPVIDKDVGPWSTEAFDLFDWRPPVREVEM